MPTLIHATHEAAYKVGGIGAVLDGLLSAPDYLARVRRSIVVGPMDTRASDQADPPRAARAAEITSLWRLGIR